MKTLIITIIIFSTTFSFAQKNKISPQMIQIGWSFISPIVLQKVNDPLTKEILSKAIPKIIKEDIKGAIFEIADATYRVKNVKILNKLFLAEQEALVTNALKAIKNKDYATAVNDIATLVTISDKYIKSGILDKPDSKLNETTDNLKTTLVKSEEVNGKVVIEKNSNYYFFVPNGFVKEIESKDTSINKFNLNLSSGNVFEIGIIKCETDDENWSIDYLEKNTESRDAWTSLVSQVFLKEKFGEGIPSPASFINTPNFKAYKLPYLVSAEASMTTSYLTFHNSCLYMIYFKSSQGEFPNNFKAFEEIISMFYFGESISFCQLKKIGKVKVINKSTYPYDLYNNGMLVETIKGKSEYNLNVPIGITNLKAIQKTGFMLYPTENKRSVTIKSPCQNETVEIGF